MQRRQTCALVGVPVFSLLAVVSVFGQVAPRPPVRVETMYPRYAARGQTTVINIAIPSRDAVQSAEISPPAGVTVAAIKGNGSETEQAIGWWEISLNVANDAAPGNRSLVLVMAMGRTDPITITIPTHVPTISNLRVTPLSNQPALDLQVAAADSANDLGDGPYVWFTAGCGGEPIVGTLRGSVSAGVVHAELPNLRNASGGEAAAGKCDLQVRITDSMGIDSNTLKTSVEFKN